MKITRHYLVCHTDDDGYNRDLVVEASDCASAVKLWKAYYWKHEEDEAEEPEYVFELPRLSGTTRALAWHKEVKNVMLYKPSAQ